MRYALTGHTRGIGASLFRHLSPKAIGFSASTGYDIRKSSDRHLIIDAAANCDIFINNAHADYAQVSLLIELFRVWKDKPKHIINVGSAVTDRALKPEKLHLVEYSAQKGALKSVMKDLQGYECKVSYVQFGYVGTDRILEKYPNMDPTQYITIDQAIEIILKPLQLP